MRRTYSEMLEALAFEESTWLTKLHQTYRRQNFTAAVLKKVLAADSGEFAPRLPRLVRALGAEKALELYAQHLRDLASRYETGRQRGFWAKFANKELPQKWRAREAELAKKLAKLQKTFDKRRRSRGVTIHDFDQIPSEWVEAKAALHVSVTHLGTAHKIVHALKQLKTNLSVFVSTHDLHVATVFRLALPHLASVKNFEIHVSTSGNEAISWVDTFWEKFLAFDAVGFFHDRLPEGAKHRNLRPFLLHHLLGSDAVVQGTLKALCSGDDSPLAVVAPHYFYTHQPEPPSKVDPELRLPLHEHHIYWLHTDVLRHFDRLKLKKSSKDPAWMRQLFTQVIWDLDARVDTLRCAVNFDRVHFMDASRSSATLIPRILKTQLPNSPNDTDCGKIAVVRGLTGGYEALLPLQFHESGVDYFVVTDDASLTLPAPYELKAVDLPGACSRKKARYAKTHLLELFSGYDTLVWIDSSVVFTGSIKTYVRDFQEQEADVGAIIHPWRDTYSQEMEECLRLGNCDETTTLAQKARYDQHPELMEIPLHETGFLLLKAKSPRLKSFFSTWWIEIDQFELRDQFSFGYALWKSQCRCVNLLPSGDSVRNHPDFALAHHTTDSSFQRELHEAFASSPSNSLGSH